MISPDFTTKEAIELEHLLSTVQALVSPELPMPEHERIESIRKLVTPNVLSALGKLYMELDNMAQAQQMLLQQPEPRTDLTSREIIALSRQQGITVSEFMGCTGWQTLSKEEAIALYRAGEITEGRLTEALGVDRLEARRILQEESDRT